MGKLLTYLYEETAQYTLGRSQRTKRPVAFSDTNRCTYVVGRSGMGKSTLLANLILTDIAQNDRSVIVLDPHNELVESIALKCPPDQAHRVVYFAPAMQRKRILGFNPFEYNSGDERELELKADALMQVFSHTWDINYRNAPTMQNTLETFTRTLLSAYPHYQTNFLHMLCLIRKDAIGDYWRKKLAVSSVENPAIMQNWDEWLEEGRRKTDIESSRQKVKHNMISNFIRPIICQSTSSACFDFDKLLNQKGVLLVALGGMDPEFVRLLGSFLLTQLLVKVKLRGHGDFAPCNVYADEFYYFNPQSFQFIMDEGRKHRIFCTMAHQSLNQLKNAKLSTAVQSCGNIIVFSVSPDDAQKMRKHFFKQGGYIKPHIVANLPQYQALIRYERGQRRPQDWIKTVEDSRPLDRAVARQIWNQSVAYGRSRSDIEQNKDSVMNAVFKTNASPTAAKDSDAQPKLKAKTKAPTKKKGFTA
ncbi:MAG: type IV secretory system conjugative DNA transfer family protein [Anaerolineales bacterium]|nr:type IV secretory system conjugative DNA transfer family protein [Anaerolineales bacterium]